MVTVVTSHSKFIAKLVFVFRKMFYLGGKFTFPKFATSL